MAMCEKCGNKGFEPTQMFIDGSDKTFVGPCCSAKVQDLRPIGGATVHVLPGAMDDVEYGVEVTNKKGVRAFVHYGGLDIAFERSPQQIRTWAEKQGLVDQKKTA